MEQQYTQEMMAAWRKNRLHSEVILRIIPSRREINKRYAPWRVIVELSTVEWCGLNLLPSFGLESKE